MERIILKEVGEKQPADCVSAYLVLQQGSILHTGVTPVRGVELFNEISHLVRCGRKSVICGKMIKRTARTIMA